MRLNFLDYNIMNRLVLSVIFLIVLVPFILAEDQSITISYNPFNSTSFYKTLDYQDFIIKINTDVDSICHYSMVKGLNYKDMTGNFDISSGKLHEKSFTNFQDGIYKFYIKCLAIDNSSTEPAELELRLIMDSLVTGQIVLSKNSPLTYGKVDLTLITSKLLSQTPSLSYSLDGLVYNDLPLYGSDTTWKSFLIIPKTAEEALGSFKLKALDLEGREGNQLTSGGVFTIDTLKPSTINYITAIGFDGKIELSWYYDENYKMFKVYRSINPNSDYTDYFNSADSTKFDDTFVDKGKTYYYRVSAIDDAGNEGDLSREVSATALIQDTNKTVSNQGLSLELYGPVDSLTTEINSTLSDVYNIRSTLSTQDKKIQDIFTDLLLAKDLDDSISGLNSLSKDVDRLKLQDLTKDELNKKLDSSLLRLNIIKKKVPENIVITSEDSRTEQISDQDIQSAILELDSNLSQKEKDNSLKATQKTMKDSKISIISNYYNLEIIYLDGTKNVVSFIKQDISAILERYDNTSFLEIIPKDVSQTASEIDVKNAEFQVIKEDPVISFSSDTKEIVYLFNKKISIESLKLIKPVLVTIYKEQSNHETSSGITGYFTYVSDNKSYLGIIICLFVLLPLLIYFFILKRSKPSSNLIKMHKLIESGKNSIKNLSISESKYIYKSIQDEYKKLNSKEKKIIIKDIDLLRERIVLEELKIGLNKLSVSPDKKYFDHLEKSYQILSEDSKLEINYLFNKVKKEVKDEK